VTVVSRSASDARALPKDAVKLAFDTGSKTAGVEALSLSLRDAREADLGELRVGAAATNENNVKAATAAALKNNIALYDRVTWT